MKIAYSAKLSNVNQNLISRTILQFTNEHIYNKDYQMINERNQWVINLWHTSEAEGFFEDMTGINYNMPWGHTGKKVIHVFIHNSKNLYKVMEGMSVLTHELAHALLYIYYKSKRYTLKHNENYSGFNGRAGQQRNFASGFVHDQLAEGKIRDFSVWQYSPTKKKITFKVVDIRDVTNSRNKKKRLDTV